MKTFLFVLVLFILGSYNAQGNLQFNQVLLLNATSNNTAQWTVPVGKVWKIETMGSYSNAMDVYLNNSIAFAYIGDYNNNFGAFYRGSDSPALWIPSGTVLGHSSSNASSFRYFSIIEFNIVP
jgi:hypothetical protein